MLYFNVSSIIFLYNATLWFNIALTFNVQKYLRRYYNLPIGLSGRKSSDVMQAKIKEMQTFLKLKVKLDCHTMTVYHSVTHF